MKNHRTVVNSPHTNRASQAARWGIGVMLLATGLLLVPAAMPAFAQQAAQPAAKPAAGDLDFNVECVIGLEHVKHHAMGNLLIVGDDLQFAMLKTKAHIPIASIQDMFTGNDSKQVFTGVGGTLVKAGVPYEGGRVLSLFSHATEVLTVEYRDASGGYHGAIFVLGKGKASTLKRDLVAKGAKASIPPEAPATEEKKP